MHDEVVPEPAPGSGRWGSDAVALTLRALGIPYLAMVPGSSYRGLHDSIVNLLGNRDPRLLVCLHEEHAVALAHGYAKVTGAPMGVALHANVGLLHATMAIFNAYCDRVPMLIVGATGPVDATRRRPWIDWIHTAADQGGLVRPFVKWDDQPASAGASVAALLRGHQLTRTHPTAPVYVCLDVTVQETELDAPPPIPPPERVAAPISDAQPHADAVDQAVDILTRAANVVVLAGPVSREPEAWKRRVELAERLGARVVTDLKVGAGFPTGHPLHAHPPRTFISEANLELLRGADAILSLDWLDLGGTLWQAFGEAPPAARVIAATLDHQPWGGWAKLDHALPYLDVTLHSRADVAVPALLQQLPLQGERGAATPLAGPPGRAAAEPAPPPAPAPTGRDGAISLAHLAATLREATRDHPVTLIRVPLSWDAAYWPVSHPLDYLGSDGGAGIGSGPGMAVGAALALQGGGRLPVAVLGDGDYLMGSSALWTAARYRIPLLVVVANNRSYYNDEIHQDRVARTRARPVGNAHVGMRIHDPDPDVAALATSLGLTGHGPVTDPDALLPTLRDAAATVQNGGQAVVDVHVERAYPSS